jgi:hypothetical protein
MAQSTGSYGVAVGVRECSTHDERRHHRGTETLTLAG